MPLKPAAYIKLDRDLIELAVRLRDEPLLAIDTESNSLHAYRERVCLVQLSTRTHDYIIDPFTIGDLSPLGDLLANPTIEKVFHAGEYDIMCLKRDFGFEFKNLFDTMIAARIAGRKLFGLSDLVRDCLGIELDKSHQLDDWGQRPLPKDSLLYAQFDTHYLPALRDLLHAGLEERGRLPEAAEAFTDLCEAPAAVDARDEADGYWRLGLPRKLPRRQMAILRELYLLREQIAEQRDTPPFKVMTNETLIELVWTQPETMRELDNLRGLSPVLIRRDGKRILQAIELGKKSQPPQPPPKPHTPSPEIVERFMALKEWRKNRAVERGVESDIILPKETLWALAHKAPTTLDDMQGINGLRPWRLSTYGVELLEVIHAFET